MQTDMNIRAAARIYVLPKCPVTKMSVTKTSYYQNVLLPKCPVTEMSCYQNVCYQNVHYQSVLYRKVWIPSIIINKTASHKNISYVMFTVYAILVIVVNA